MSDNINDLTKGKNGYRAFYANKPKDLHADSMLEAKNKAVAFFKPPRSKQHMVSVVLCEKEGKTVTHMTSEFG